MRQHLFGERNVAFHWQSSKNAEEIIKTFKRKKRYSWARRRRWRQRPTAAAGTGRIVLTLLMSVSTHHLDIRKWRSTWMRHSAKKKKKKSGAGVLGGHSFAAESPCRTMTHPTKTWPVLQPQPSQRRHNGCERDHRVHFSVDGAAVLMWFRSLSVTFTFTIWMKPLGWSDAECVKCSHPRRSKSGWGELFQLWGYFSIGTTFRCTWFQSCCFVCIHTDVCNIYFNTTKMLLFNTINELKTKWTCVNILFTIKQTQKNLFVLFFLFFYFCHSTVKCSFQYFFQQFHNTFYMFSDCLFPNQINATRHFILLFNCI